MKRIILLAITALTMTFTFTAKADNSKPVRFENLPENSQKFVHTHFKGTEISYIKQESDFFLWKSYDLFFVNGSKIEFDRKGNWEEVDCMRDEVPAAIVPAAITTYINRNHAGMKIVKISRNSKEYEVKLNNGIEIKFDKRFNVIEYDN